MHRNSFLPRTLVWTVLLAAWLFGPLAAGNLHAQDQKATTVYVPLGGSEILQMSKSQLIQEFKSDDARIARVDRVQNDLRKVAVTVGNQPGRTLVTLRDEAGKAEVFEIVVENDIETLKRVIKTVFPTSNLTVTKAGANIILSGNVAKATEIDAILRTAASIAGDPLRVINSMTVGGVQQVQLDVVVARVARSEARQMGFSFLESGQQQFYASTTGGAGSLSGMITSGINNATAALTSSPNLVFGLLDDSRSFTGYLEALRTDSLVKLLAKPKLIALSGQPADFISGGEQAVPDLASGGAGGGAVAGVRFVPFGTTVRFLPIVLGGGKIYMEVEPQFTFPDPSNLFSAPIPGTSTVVFGRTTQRVRTSVIMEDGQTYAIGGMIFHQVNGTNTKVPVLGDLPFIGFFFGNITYTDSEEELIILVTPHLIDPIDCGQGPKALPGQESRRPDDFELFLERILEAPRGPRDVFVDGHYTPAFKNSPTNSMFPCPRCNGPRGACDVPFAGPESPLGNTGAVPVMVSPAPRVMAPVQSVTPTVTPVQPTPVRSTPAQPQSLPEPRTQAPVVPVEIPATSVPAPPTADSGSGTVQLAPPTEGEN